MRRSRSNPSNSAPIGNLGVFFTSGRYLNSDRLGTQIAEIDRTANEAFEAIGLGCSGYEKQLTAITKLDKAAWHYADMIEQMQRDKVSRDEDIFLKASYSMDAVLYQRSVLEAEINDCFVRHVYPEINNVASGPGSSENADEAYIRTKIRKTKLNQPCGFRTFDDIAGGSAYRKFFTDYTVAPFELKNYSEEIRGTLGTMMFGPPGTGKTMFVEAVASEVASMGVSVYSVTSSVIKGKYVGESEKSLQILFEEARRDTNGGKKPCIIFIDEAEGLIDEKAAANGGGTGLLAELNSQMEGLGNTSNKGLIVIIATNYPENIPTAALSRFVNKIFVGLPSAQDVREILIKNFTSMGAARFNLEAGFEVEIDTLPDGSFRKQLLDEVAWKAGTARPDAIDLFSQMVADLRYAPREIEGLFTFIRGITYGASREFYRDKVPRGSKPANGLDYVVEQHWILDETKYKTKVISGEGRSRSCKVEEEIKHMLIPIGFSEAETIPSGSEGAFTYGVLGKENSKTKPVQNKKKERWHVVTKRKFVPSTKDSEVGGWEYTMIKKEDENGVLKPLAQPIKMPAAKMHEYLGATQVTVGHLESAINSVKPVRIKNARKMLEYSLNPGRTISKPYAANFDLQVLSEMAREEGANDTSDSFSGDQLAKLIKQVQNIVLGGPNSGMYSVDNYQKYLEARGKDDRIGSYNNWLTSE